MFECKAQLGNVCYSLPFTSYDIVEVACQQVRYAAIRVDSVSSIHHVGS